MSYCLSPVCRKRENPDNLDSCQSCGSKLLLKERYRTIKPIAGGGFGKTFLAMDEDMPSKQYCVIKQFFYQGNRDIKKAEQLFRQEAVQLEILGKQHSQIPKLLAHFELGSGLYLVQEFIDGQDLLKSHVWDVLTVAISPDSQILASGSTDHTIKIWHLATGKLLATKYHYIYDKKSADIHCITFSLSGKTLVSGSWCTQGETAAIHLWKLGTMEVLQTFRGHSGWVNSTAFSPDGQILASGGQDQTIKLWNLNTGKLINTLDKHSGPVNSIAFSPNGTILASGSTDTTIKIWNFATGELLNTFAEHLGSVNSVAISPDGQILASGSTDHTIKIWHLATGKLLKTFTEHSTSVNSVTFSPNGQILASGNTDRTIKIWHLATGELLKTFMGHSESVNSVTFSPDGQILASGSSDKTIKIWQCNC
ncbi:hypothetical protein JYQ62_34310 [Nostoc sp. UHCC 0702]|nr:hypothetical protein JYQ62_34310 [Nostoc sp. UHCC 0702]